MKLIFREFTIQTETFDEILYLKDFDLLAFTYKPKWDAEQTHPVVLNLCFSNGVDARNVYRQYLQGRGVRDELNFKEYECSWPTDLAMRIEADERFYLKSL